MEPSSPALTGRSFTTELPGKPYFTLCILVVFAACRILVPQPGIEIRHLGVKVWSPNCWTTSNGTLDSSRGIARSKERVFSIFPRSWKNSVEL